MKYERKSLRPGLKELFQIWNLANIIASEGQFPIGELEHAMGENFPYEGAVEKSAEALVPAIKTISDFASFALGPAFEHGGQILGDIAYHYRIRNLARLIERTEELLSKEEIESRNVTPRICFEVMEKGSWVEDHVLQDMWAGLLASSFSKDRGDDSNLSFINLLSQMSSVQAGLLNEFGSNVKQVIVRVGTILSATLSRENDGSDQKSYKLPELAEQFGCTIQRIGAELASLESMGILTTPQLAPIANIVTGNLKGLGLELYMRTRGSSTDLKEFCQQNSIQMTEWKFTGPGSHLMKSE